MDKYLSQKYKIYRHQMCTKTHFGWGSAPDPCGGAYDAPTDSYSAGGGH